MTDTDNFNETFDEIESQVAKAVKEDGQEMYVCYSAYEEKDGKYVNNLAQVAVKGEVILVHDRSEFYGGAKSEPYRSEILTDPTWLEVAIHANRMIRQTRDHHHVFLEGLTKLDTVGGTGIYRFVMGS